MKILVPIKIAASLDDHSSVRDGSIDRDAVEWDINEWDMFALEAALQVLESRDGGELVVVTVGGDEVDDGCSPPWRWARIGRSMSRSMRTAYRSTFSSSQRSWVPSIEPEAPDLVLCGVQSSDTAAAATGVALAGLLDMPRVAVVRSIVVGDGTAEVHRELEGGLVEELEVPLPAVLTVQTGINEPRYANLRGIAEAKDKPRVVVEPAVSGSPVRTSRQSPAPDVSLWNRFIEAPAPRCSTGSRRRIAAQIAAIVRSKVSA